MQFPPRPEPDNAPDPLLDRLPGMVYRGPAEPRRPLWTASGAVLELTGRTAAELGSAAPLAECIHPDDRHDAWAGLLDALSKGCDYHLVYRLRLPGGEIRWVMDQGRMSAAEPGLLEGMMMDVTSRQAREADFRQAYKMDAVGRLAGEVAEEFSSVLTTIRGYASLVAMGLPEGDPLRQDLGEIEAAVERATERTRYLLDFGRQPLLAPEMVDANEVVRSMEETLRHVVGDEVELAVSLASRLGQVRVHHSQVEQVLLNLVVNARDACGPGARILLETGDAEVSGDAVAQPGAHVALTVSDSGCGMDEPTLERIFEPFFTTKGQAQGAGIGLSVVYRIARQHGGSVRVESTPGSGTTVRVLLPRSAEGAIRTDATRPPRWTGTVLLVDDEPAVRQYLRRALEQCGLTVLEAGSGDEALACLPATGVDLVVTDVVMPRMSGRELVRRITALHPGTPALFLSGYFADAPRGDAFLTKPFSPQALWEKLGGLLGGGAPVTEVPGEAA